MEEEAEHLSAIHLPLTGCEEIPRVYGRILLLTDRRAQFKQLQSLYVEINPGQATSNHHHPNEELYFVLEGEVVLHTEEVSFLVREHDTVLLPPHTPHQLENKSSTVVCRLIIALSPPRDSQQVVYI